MERIKVKELEPGMILAKDICNRNGRLLLGAGCELEEKHIKAFQAWGVIVVDIEGDGQVENDNSNPIDPVILASVKSLVQQKFRHTDPDHPFIQELFNETIERKAREKLEAEPGEA